jgi:hypothetical protein
MSGFRVVGQDRWLWLIVALAAILLFWNLSGRCLWQDEAETALLGKNILCFGLPYAWDGKNLISQEEGREFTFHSRQGTGGPGPDGLWRWSPWIQCYVAALSMSIFGATTFGARFLFVVAALLSVPLTYLLAVRLFGSRPLARWSALFLSLSVPFLLYARQCRWYGVAYPLLVCLFLCVLALARERKGAWSGLVISAVLLWYTNFFLAAGLLVALAAAAPVYRWERRFLIRFGLGLAAIGIFTLPSFVIFSSIGSGVRFEWARTMSYLAEYASEYFVFLVPLPIAAILVYAVAARGEILGLCGQWRRTALFLITFCICFVLVLSTGPFAFFRYLNPLLPITSILLALGVSYLAGKNFWIGMATVALVLFTDILHQFPLAFLGAPGSQSNVDLFVSIGPQTTYRNALIDFPLLCYFREIRRPIDDAERIVAQYLNEHAASGDVVLSGYGDLALQFHTGLKVIGGPQEPISAKRMSQWRDSDWLFPRRVWLGRDRNMSRFIWQGLLLRDLPAWVALPLEPHALARLTVLEELQYIRTPVRGTDIATSNCPEPQRHLFDVLAPSEAKEIFGLAADAEIELYQRRRDRAFMDHPPGPHR